MLGQRRGVTRSRSSESFTRGSRQPALGRRRGTRSGKNGSILNSFYGVLLLLGVGLGVGLVIGVVFLGPNGGGHMILPFMVQGGGGGNGSTRGTAAGGGGGGAAAAVDPPKVVGVDALLRKGAGALQRQLQLQEELDQQFQHDQMIEQQLEQLAQHPNQDLPPPKRWERSLYKNGSYLQRPIVTPFQNNPVLAAQREHEAAHAAIGALQPGSKTTQEFLAHIPIIGTQGPFPHYPNGDKHNLVDPNHDFTTFTAPGGFRFEEYKNGDSPYSYQPGESDDLARSRRIHVKHAMQHAWTGYTTYAFGKDELLPQSLTGHNNWGGMGTTLVDSLDTLWLMNMTEEFQQARDWCQSTLDHNVPRAVSMFETTIRSLGGLLSAYDWSGDVVFLNQAKDLGKRLFRAFDNPTGIPYGQVNLATGLPSNIGWTGGNAITAEFGTLQIEFRMLGRLSGIHGYKDKSEYVYDLLKDLQRPDGLYPYFIRNKGHKPEFANDKITFGAMGDSLYEYMLKIWVQGGKTEPKYRDMYDKAIQGMHDHLLQVSSPSGLVFIADRNNGVIDTKMDHLVCFMGGLLALGAYTDPLGLESERAQRDLKTGKALTYTCYQMYARMNTGIAAEFVQFYPGKDFEIGRGAPHYLLRPETVESFFVLSQLTGDPVYREWGWEVFQAIERYCKTQGGYGSLRDVQNTQADPQNKMESFFLAETIKYLYLLFDPETQVDILNKHVFNTEAHPVRTFAAMDADGVPNLLL